MLRRDLLLVVLVGSQGWRYGAAQDSFITVTSPVSGDAFEAGDEVRVAWESSLDSSLFDISLLNDGVNVGDAFCEDGCLAPNGFLIVTLPTGLEAGDTYSILVGDRVNSVSSYGESELFEIIVLPASGNNGSGAGSSAADAPAATAGDGSDGPGQLVLGIVIGLVAATILSVTVFVVVRRGCCSKSKIQANENVLKTQQSDASDSGFVLDADIGRDLFCSSGGVSDSGASLAALAEMGGLSPVLEENAEVVTKNPMRAAIANGAQFHSVSADSVKFNSNGGSSKFQSFGGDSSKFTSSLGGDSSRREEADDDEGGGMFADADVVAVLAAAAAAAQQVGKEDQDQVVVKKSGMGTSRRGWYQAAGGNWVKSPSWNGENVTEAVTVEQASSTSCASALEEKVLDAANDTAQVPRASAVDWMVSTRKNLDKDASRGAGWLGALKNACDTVSQQEEKDGEVAQSPEIVSASTTATATTIVSTAAMADEKKEYLGDGQPTAVVAASSGGKTTAAAASSESQPPFPSPQMVDGISARAFGQAEMVADELPWVTTGRGSVSEPECEVPKPAPIARKSKFGEYSWLSSSGRNLKDMAKKADADEAEHARVKTPLPVGTAAPVAPAQRALKVPTTNGGLAHKVESTAGGSASATSRKAASVLPTDTAADLSTATTTPGSTAGRGQTPAPEPLQQETAVLHLPPKAQGTTTRCPPLTPVGGVNGVINPTACSSPSPKKPSWLAPLVTPDKSSRVSQVVEAFERLTPGVKSAAVTPGTFTPGALTPGAAGWTTPVATPDRTPQTLKVPPEEQKVGKEKTNPPDRSLKTSAPDSGPGGATPERTATPNGAFIGGKMGVSPTDERQFVWKLESPAGVDGLPSPNEADIQATAASRKKGRVIPTILGAADTVATEGTPVLTPSTADSKPRQLRRLRHGMVSSGDSSSGTGWEVEPSFGASQVAAFVADAKAEAEAEARTAAIEAEAEAAQEEREEEREEEEEKDKREIDPNASVVQADGTQLVESEAPAALPATSAVADAEVVAVAVSPMKGNAVQEVEAAAVEAVEAAAEAHAEAHAEGYIDGDADTDAGSFMDALADTPRAEFSSSTNAFEALDGEKEEDSGVTAEAAGGTMPDGGGGGKHLGLSTESAVAGGPKETEGDGYRQEQRQEREMGASDTEREESGEEKKEHEGEEASLHEAAEVAALVAEAMALADDGGNHERALYPPANGEEEGGGVEAEQVDDYSDGSSERGGRASHDRGAFASSKSILTWTEGEDVEEGDAERDAEEVKALVAEALALIKEASEDATMAGEAPGY